MVDRVLLRAEAFLARDQQFAALLQKLFLDAHDRLLGVTIEHVLATVFAKQQGMAPP
jgi:hypothetical protein